MQYELRDAFVVSADLPEVWTFFSAVDNLPKITPPWLKFTTSGKPVKISQGSVLNYTIRWLGIPIRWRTLITEWEPPTRFVDLQIQGPYSLWHHTHEFRQTSDGVECRDRVLYRLPLGPVGSVTHRLIAKRQLLEIFRYRRTVIGENLGGIRFLQEDIAIASASVPLAPFS